MKHLSVITDLQWGSCGKGLFAGYLAKRLRPDTIIAAWGPNSGHTFIDAQGNQHVNIMVPNGVVASSVKQILLGPGSIIEPMRLLEEMARYGLLDPARGTRLAIHEHAAVVLQQHRDAEAIYGFAIGSTMKGVGEAVIQKIKRGSPSNVAKEALKGTPLEPYVVTVQQYNDLLDAAEVAILEGAQGFSLSINQGIYPYTTSRDCTTHQLLSDCGIPRTRWGRNRGMSSHAATYDMTVCGVARTYPIRVANRFVSCLACRGSGDGERHPAEGTLPCASCGGKGQRQVGTSGPGYPDQMECKWEDIGVQPELTTVTKLPRRIFTFSAEQIRQAVRMNGVDSVFLNFCQYPKDPLELARIMQSIESTGADIRWTGWGPREDQIKAVGQE